MSSKDIVISVKNLSKYFEIYDRPVDRLKQFLLPKIQKIFGRVPRKYFREFCALNNVSFEIGRGETVGIVGKNGSGKSTLLQMICGTLTPTEGFIQTNGRVAALLELGSGFNPEFTGRENVFMNASVLGLSNDEIEACFKDIEIFADIGEFIDQPVKTYSSGMIVRLAFAVIAHVNANILVIDEALSVGDTFFTQKCMRFIRDFQSRGGSILFVSHDISSVIGLCSKAVLLSPNRDQAPISGNPVDVCNLYLNDIYNDSDRLTDVKKNTYVHDRADFNLDKMEVLHSSKVKDNRMQISRFDNKAKSFGDRGVVISDAYFVSADNSLVSEIYGGQRVSLMVCLVAKRLINFPAVGVIVKDRLGQFLFTEGTDSYFRDRHLMFNTNEDISVTFNFVMPILSVGAYTITLAVAEGLGDDHIQHHWIYDAIKLESITSPVVHGISGFVDSKIEMRFQKKS